MQSPTDSPGQSVIVVGGGIIGIACAHYLNRAGLAVTVIDRGRIAGACSHANCGYICPSHVLPLTEPEAIGTALKSLLNPNAPFRVKPSLSPTLFRWMMQFARRCNHRQMLASAKRLQAILDSSMSAYRELIATDNLDCQWKDRGLLYVFRSAKGLDRFAATDRMLTEKFGVTADMIPGEQLPDFDAALKQGLAGAFHYRCDASLRPDQLADRWKTLLISRGVRFIESCELKSIDHSGPRIERLNTSQGELAANSYVFATGAWSPLLAKQIGCFIPIQPGKGYSVTMQRPDACPSHPMLFPEHKVGVTPFDDGYRLGSMMEFAGYDTSIPDRRINQLRRSAEPYLVEPHTSTVQETWYGWRPMTWDSLPIIGPVPRTSNAHLATGHNMLGMSLATATGKLIAEMITDQPTHIDATAYSPTRF